MDPDRQAIRELVENWAVWRDAGDWARFATVWHDDGWMTATWFQGPATKFIEVSREGFERGVSILHFLGGFACDVNGHRAIAQTKMTINQRATVDGVLVDVVCTGRFYDFLERRPSTRPGSSASLGTGPSTRPGSSASLGTGPSTRPGSSASLGTGPSTRDGSTPSLGTWGIVRRQPIYEKDRMDPIDPSASLRLDAERLSRFPEGYRHLGYLQSKNGFNVKGDLPGLRGPAVEKLYEEGTAWLAGSPTPGTPL